VTKQQAPAGPKRHTAVDSFGKRAVVVTASSVPEGQASKQVLSFGLPDGTKGSTAVFDLLVDRGDSSSRFLQLVMDSLGWIIQVVLPPQQIQGLVLRKKRSVVEQSFSWLN
jgi:transposase